MSRPAAMPLRSNLVTGRSAQRSTDPAARAAARRRGPRPSARRSRPSRSPAATRRRARAAARPGSRSRRDQAALVVPRLVPGVGEEDPEPGQAAGVDQVLERPDGVDAQHPHVGQARRRRSGRGCRRRPDATPRTPRRRGRAASAASSTVDSPMPEPISTISGASRPNMPGQREAGLVDRLVGQPPPLGVRRPGLLLARREPAAPPGVRQHLAHPAAVVGQLVVRAGRSDAFVVHGHYLRCHDRPHPNRVAPRPGGGPLRRDPPPVRRARRAGSRPAARRRADAVDDPVAGALPGLRRVRRPAPGWSTSTASSTSTSASATPAR